MFTFQLIEHERRSAEPWNERKQFGQRRPLKPKEIRGARIRLQRGHRIRDHGGNAGGSIGTDSRSTLDRKELFSSVASLQVTSPLYKAIRPHRLLMV